MAINNDRNLLEQQILSNSGLKGKELENLRARLATLSEQQLQAELSKSLSGNNKGEWYTGVMLEHNESVIMRNNHEQTTYTDDSGNEISELKDGDEVLERTIKSTDDKGNVFETTVTFSGGRPLTQTKTKNGNTTETTTYKYNDDADVPFVTVETKKADQSKVMTNVLEIDENGNFGNEDFIDRQTTSMDGTTTHIFTENNCVIEQQVKPNGKKIDTIYNGDSIEDYDNKKLHRVYQRTELKGEVHEVAYDGNGNTRTVVQNGESPSAIAKKFGVKESSLRKLNPARGKNAITQVGADIVVPGEYNADARVMTRRKSKQGAMQDFANDEVGRVAERLYSSSMQEVTLDKDYKDAYSYARALLAADGVKNPSNHQVNNKANEILVANGNIKFKKGTKVQIAAKAPDSKFVTELSNNGFKPTRENAIFYNRFNALNSQQQQNVLSVIKYCRSQKITDPNKIKARILETFPEINLFDSGKVIPMNSSFGTPAYQRKNPVALETFLTETLKLDLKSDVGRQVYERLASLPQEELGRINGSNFGDLSKSDFNDIANRFETSGVNIRTQFENQIELNRRNQQAERLGIPQQKFTSEMLANIYDRAADMMEEYYHNHGVFDAGTYLEGLKNITDWITPDNLFGIDMRSTLHVASDCRKAAQRFRQMHTDNPETFKREYAQLKKDGLVTADYNQQNVQEFMNLIQSGDVDINSDKFKNACKKAFGFKGVENTEKYIQTGQMAGNIGDIAVMLYTLGAASELKVMGKATQGVYGALEKGAGKFMSKTAAQKTAKIGTSMTMGGTTLGGFTLGKETLNNLSNPMRDATNWETWKETGIASAESFGFGAFGGLLNETVVAPIVKAIEKPATKATQAVSKALTEQGELTGKQIMQTVSESGGLKLDGLFKMNSQELANFARTATAKGVGFGAEVTGFTAYEAGLDVIKDLIDPKTGRLPDNIDVKYLCDKFGEQLSNLGTIKGVSMFLMMRKGGKVAQKAMLNEFLSESEALKNIKFKKAEINGHEVYEVTYPNGNRAVVSSPEQAIATCQMAMQMEFLAKSLSEVETGSVKPQTRTQTTKPEGEVKATLEIEVKTEKFKPQNKPDIEGSNEIVVDKEVSGEPRIKIEYKDTKTEKEVLIEKVDKMLDDILSRVDTSTYNTKRKKEGIELLEELLWDDVDLKLTAEEKELMKAVIVKQSYGSVTADKIRDNDKSIVHRFLEKYNQMTEGNSNIIWVLRCLKDNNGLNDEQFNPFEVYNTLYKGKIFKRLSAQEINIVNDILTSDSRGSVEEQIKRAKFDYREIANRDLVNLIENKLGLSGGRATDYYEEFLYCTKEEFEAKIQRINERPELIDNVKKFKFETWKNLLNMPIEEYRKIVTPVENREGGTLDTDAYRRTIKTELEKPQPYDIQEALEVSSERNFIFSFGTRAYRAEKLVQFKPLEKTKTEVVLENLPTTKESMEQLEQNGKVQIDIKNKGGLNPTRTEEPIIHPDDVSRLGQVEKAGIKIKYGAKTNWSNSKIARDIMQNFYDGNGHTLEGVNIEVTKTPEGKYVVKVSGEGNYDYDRLESLGNSSKDGDSSNAGAFGEGTRIVAVNLLARPDTKNIKYACGEWEMNFGRSSDDIQTADMTQTLNKNSQKVKGNYIEFETADEELVKEILNSKDYFYQPYNKDFQNFDYENEFFGFKLLPNEKGNIYVVQRYETQDGIENSLENLSLVFKKMPNDPEITEKNDGQEFEIETGRDRILLSERKIGELISRYLKTVPDEELMQTLATMKDSWIVSKEKTPNKMLLPLIEEAKSRKLGFAFEEPDAKTKKIMKAFGIGLKYMAVPEVASPNDIEMIRLMGYTPVIHELAGMGIQEFARPNENQKQPIVPTQRELQKLQLVSEAVGVIKDNLELENYGHISDKEAHAPTIIVEEGTDPNEAAEAILSNGELKGEWMTRAHLECERFTTLLSTKLHEITHKYGGDISSSFSDALVNLQVTIMKGLVHNPESLAKLRVLEDVFNEVDGKSVVEKYVADGKFNALKFSKDIEKILSEPFYYVEYKEETNQGIAKSMSKSINIETLPIDEGSGLLAKVRRVFRKSKGFYPAPMSSKYEVPTKKYEFEHPERQEYTKIETTLPTTNEVLTQLSESGRVEISIPNKGGMNPTNAENPIIHTDDISKLDKILKAKIKIRYGAKTNWSEFKIARDIMQNFYDGNGHTLEGVDIKIDRDPDGSYRVRISGNGQYDYSHLESIGDSTKDGDFDNAGAFGEGTRIVAVNLLSHLDTPYVKYACGDWEMNFGRSSDDIQTADMTQTLHKNSSPVKGNYIEFKTGNEKLIKEIINSKDFFYHPENPDFQNMLYENEFFGIKVLENKEKQGSFYLVQKYETENPEQDMKGISIVLKKGDKDPEIKKAQGHNIIVRRSVETGRDRVSISSSQARELGRTYGMTMSEQELVHTISALRNFYTLPVGSLLGRNLDNEKLINSTELNFICGLVSAAASKHIQIDLKDLKMATVSDSDLKYNEQEVSDLLKRGYRFVPESFKDIGVPNVSLAYKNEHRIKSLEPTKIEHQKLQLINEAIQLFAKNDTRGTIPKITPDKLYIFDASAQKHTDIYAAVNDKNLKGLFVDRQYLENTDFLNTVTRIIASSLRVHGDDISANYSYELTDLITSEVNTLMHKPEIAQKLQILKAKYDTLK